MAILVVAALWFVDLEAPLKDVRDDGRIGPAVLDVQAELSVGEADDAEALVDPTRRAGAVEERCGDDRRFLVALESVIEHDAEERALNQVKRRLVLAVAEVKRTRLGPHVTLIARQLGCATHEKDRMCDNEKEIHMRKRENAK